MVIVLPLSGENRQMDTHTDCDKEGWDTLVCYEGNK